MQSELEQQKQKQVKLEESMKDAGISVGDGDTVQVVSPTINPTKVANTKFNTFSNNNESRPNNCVN